MEGITEINKDDYIDNCLKIVKEMITEEDFSDEIWLALTGEIMDTCLFIGGDFEEANIQTAHSRLNSYPCPAKQCQIRW